MEIFIEKAGTEYYLKSELATKLVPATHMWESKKAIASEEALQDDCLSLFFAYAAVPLNTPEDHSRDF